MVMNPMMIMMMNLVTKATVLGDWCSCYFAFDECENADFGDAF